jgi:hypothetical protein
MANDQEPQPPNSQIEPAGTLRDQDEPTSREHGEIRRLAEELRASWKKLSAPLHRSHDPDDS